MVGFGAPARDRTKMLSDYQEPALDSAVDEALLEFIAKREAEIGDRTL